MAVHPSVMSPSVRMGSSGIWPVRASAAPEPNTTAPAAPNPTDMSALKPTCHRRRVLRSWKNEFQSKGGMSGFDRAYSSARCAARNAAAASASWSRVVEEEEEEACRRPAAAVDGVLGWRRSVRTGEDGVGLAAAAAGLVVEGESESLERTLAKGEAAVMVE